MTGRAARLPAPRIRPTSFALKGGLDLSTSAPLTPPGRLISMLNYEMSPDGVRRIDGFERFDGHTRPSQASYWVLNFDAGTAAITAGQIVTGATSGATGEALIDAVVSTGTYGGSNAAGYLVLFNVTGTFQDNENLQVSAVTKSVANGTALERGAGNDTDDMTWLRDAIETARGDISAVTGSGVIRGVRFYNGKAYAFRDNAGATACVMFQSSASGWAAVTMPKQIAFTSGGTYEIVEGNTITGATSAATGVVRRVNLTGGTFSGGDAVGWLIFDTQTGTFQAENLNVGANLNVATIAGNSATVALPAGGRYEFRNFNFYGASDRYRMYGVNGVGTAFEWDGTTFAPIHTGMTTDTPNHIAIHELHLVLTFPGGSLQASSTGEPHNWDAVLGASEIGIGDDVTGMVEAVGSTLAVFARNKVAVLYGKDVSDFQLQPYSGDAGAIEWTAQMIVSPIYMDDGGVRDMKATQAFGDFKMGTLTRLIEPLLRSKRNAGTTPVASVSSRNKTSYRLFFSDGTGISIFLGAKDPEIGVFNLGMVVSCVSQSEETNGSEIILFGSSDGYVYQLDAGNSFDGEEMDYFARPAFCHGGTPDLLKSWKNIILNIDAPSAIDLQVSAEFDYGDTNQPSAAAQDFTLQGGGGFWDEATWNEFEWSSPVKGTAQAYVEGVGANISACFAGSTTYSAPHTLQTVTYRYSERGLKR